MHADEWLRLIENAFQRFTYLGFIVGWTEMVQRQAQETAPTEERVTPFGAAQDATDDGPQEFIREKGYSLSSTPTD